MFEIHHCHYCSADTHANISDLKVLISNEVESWKSTNTRNLHVLQHRHGFDQSEAKNSIRLWPIRSRENQTETHIGALYKDLQNLLFFSWESLCVELLEFFKWCENVWEQ